MPRVLPGIEKDQIERRVVNIEIPLDTGAIVLLSVADGFTQMRRSVRPTIS